MKSYIVKTPSLVPKLYRNQTWSFSSKEKNIYLTFDDGPTPEITDWVLDTLEQYNAKATFFCIGKNIELYPDIFKRIIKEDHTIGNHTYDHLKGWETNIEDYINSVLKTERIIQNLINPSLKTHHAKFFRPPYGRIKKSQTKELIKQEYDVIMWSVLSADYDQTISPEKCLNNVLRNTNNGSIIVFHDSVKASNNLQFVLPKVLEHFSKKEYTFKKIENSEVA